TQAPRLERDWRTAAVFGKRSTLGPDNARQAAGPAPAAVMAPPAPAPAPEPPRETPRAAPAATVASPPLSPAAPPAESRRSDAYYEVKGTIFGALIEAIDLSQLARLEADAAREEIRDIVNEIIAIKNIVMSISEQEELLDDICNDVLGY